MRRREFCAASAGKRIAPESSALPCAPEKRIAAPAESFFTGRIACHPSLATYYRSSVTPQRRGFSFAMRIAHSEPALFNPQHSC
jgi:hypothetical protein